MIVMSMAFSTAIILRVAELARQHAHAVISSNTLMLPGYEDLVCWNGSALAGGPDVVWVWTFSSARREHDGFNHLNQTLAAMCSELGVEAVPGPPFAAGRTSPDIGDTEYQWVSVSSSALYRGVEIVDTDLTEYRQADHPLEPAAVLKSGVRVASDKNHEADRYLAGRFPHAYPRTPPRLKDSGRRP
ncbi:hypothetical protein [Catellatospora sp. NPDC049609]|uniref:hypothetical protein n=1 Tax=Catellatospora sp. NPDC049609 TaxID=3155505 RepID=UPI00342D07E8